MKISAIPADQLPATKPKPSEATRKILSHIESIGASNYWQHFFNMADKTYERYGTHELILVDGIYYHRSVSGYSLYMSNSLENAKRAIDILEE